MNRVGLFALLSRVLVMSVWVSTKVGKKRFGQLACDYLADVLFPIETNFRTSMYEIFHSAFIS